MSSEQVAGEWRADVYRLAWLRLGVRGSVAFCLLWGVVSLVMRGMLEASGVWLWWGGTGLAVVWVVAGVLAKRQVPSFETTMSLLDRENQLGGLLMAGSAGGHEAWADRVAVVRAPRVHWRGLPSSGALGLSVVFVLAALFVPMPKSLQANGMMDVSRSVATMQQQVEVLEEEQILDSPEAEEIRQALERIREQASGDDPSKTWEALDHLARQIEEASDEANDLAQQRMEEAAAAQALAKALEQDSASLSPERLSEAMKTLAELSDAAAGQPTLEGLELPEELAEALAEALAGAEGGAGQEAPALTPEMLEQMAEALEGREGDLQKMLEALAEAGLGELGELGEGAVAEAEEIDLSELKAWLKGEGKCDKASLLAACRRGGRGGIDQGPGHMEMTWQDPSSKQGVEFAPELLPPARLRELREARKLGTSRGAPQEIEGAQGSEGGALNQAQSGGGSATHNEVLPRHRGAVKRYFERDADGQQQ